MQATTTAHQQRAPPPPPPPLAPPPPPVSLAMPTSGSPATEGFLADLIAGRSPRGAPPPMLAGNGAQGGAGDARCGTDATAVGVNVLSTGPVSSAGHCLGDPPSSLGRMPTQHHLHLHHQHPTNPLLHLHRPPPPSTLPSVDSGYFAAAPPALPGAAPDRRFSGPPALAAPPTHPTTLPLQQHQQHQQQQPYAHPQAPSTIPPGLSVAPAHGDPPAQATLPPPAPSFAITAGSTGQVQPLLTQLQRRFSDFGPLPTGTSTSPATMLATMDVGSPWSVLATSAGPATALATSDPATPLAFLADQQATSLPSPPALMGPAPKAAPLPDRGGAHGSQLPPPLLTSSSDAEQQQQQHTPLPAAGIQFADLVKAAARSDHDDPHLALDAPLAPETTRWLCVAGLDRTISPQDLEVFKSFGDINHLVSRMLAPYGVVLLAFFDIRQAQAAARRLRSLASATAPEWRVQFITAADFQESTGVSLTEQVLSSELALSQLPVTVDAAGLKNLGQLFGEVRSVQVDVARAVVDYFDARKADAALQGLPGVIRSVYNVSIHAERILPAGMHPAPSAAAAAPAPTTGKSRVNVLRTGDAGGAFDDRAASQLLDQSLLQSIAREQDSHTPPPLVARTASPAPMAGTPDWSYQGTGTGRRASDASATASAVAALLASTTAAAAANTPTATAATAPPPSMSALYSSPDTSLLGDLLDSSAAALMAPPPATSAEMGALLGYDASGPPKYTSTSRPSSLYGLGDSSYAGAPSFAPQPPQHRPASRSHHQALHQADPGYMSSPYGNTAASNSISRGSAPHHTATTTGHGYSTCLRSNSALPKIDLIPRENEFDVLRILSGKDTRTTIMIRNIPNKYSQQMLIDFINESHRGQYDFLYLRMDFKNKCNVGYAFCNMVNVAAVVSFAQRVVGKKWTRFNSDKVCMLSYANIQGKQALIDKFRNSSVMDEHPSYRPKIFYTSGPLAGEEEVFPPPTNRAHRHHATSHHSAGGGGGGGGGGYMGMGSNAALGGLGGQHYSPQHHPHHHQPYHHQPYHHQHHQHPHHAIMAPPPQQQSSAHQYMAPGNTSRPTSLLGDLGSISGGLNLEQAMANMALDSAPPLSLLRSGDAPGGASDPLDASSYHGYQPSQLPQYQQQQYQPPRGYGSMPPTSLAQQPPSQQHQQHQQYYAPPTHQHQPPSRPTSSHHSGGGSGIPPLTSLHSMGPLSLDSALALSSRLGSAASDLSSDAQHLYQGSAPSQQQQQSQQQQPYHLTGGSTTGGDATSSSGALNAIAPGSMYDLGSYSGSMLSSYGPDSALSEYEGGSKFGGQQYAVPPPMNQYAPAATTTMQPSAIPTTAGGSAVPPVGYDAVPDYRPRY
ncbi:hypothetical protein AMAG_01197 [Allomyces macrogynus ATCC 38327]|uniref:Mei2-like C-terminal RNA recognition motif domain-containing protein n=1 Tax=Allomyces macrogynus (strain ATCC 38327) TaxID=578462 RepID=A0A0L0RY10_ALLM3|nr:hypothetical protein AMAG_01197 [Allomyces macrogynus ATCC 38327]|eukprot:KNE55287.1 hypothetical protein AMAG_01197 [Allomyces macrogynus ATCC 38327]